MAVILENTKLLGNTYKMLLKLNNGEKLGSAGQFYMVKTSTSCDPLLSRPISIFNTDTSENTLTFIYEVVGRGTLLMSQMKIGDSITVHGPYGNTFPLVDSDVTYIGGGVGAAPLYLLAKEQKQAYPNRKVKIHIGFRNNSSIILTDEFKKVCDELIITVGGYVTDNVNFAEDAVYYTCGTNPMMEAVCRLAIANNRKLYLSLDKHMACGVGACLVCTCKTSDGTKKRACKDGPIFLATDVFDVERGKFYE